MVDSFFWANGQGIRVGRQKHSPIESRYLSKDTNIVPLEVANLAASFVFSYV